MSSDHRVLANLSPVPTSPHVREAVSRAARTGGRTRPSWLVLAAMLLLVLAVAGAGLAVGALIRQFDRSPDTRLGWLAGTVPGLEAGDGSRIRAAAGGPGGYVAVGGTAGGAAFWRSADGMTWLEVARPAGTDGAELLVVVAGGPGFIAGGRASATGPGLFVSADGMAWEPAGPPAAVSGAGVEAIAAGRGGWVAVGSVITATGAQGASWVTLDGRTWQRSIEEPPGGETVRPRLIAVAALGTGWLAIEGAGGAPSDVYRSDDGLEWRPLSVEGRPVSIPGDVRALATTAAGVLAVGSANDGRAAIWASPDGFVWARQSIVDAPRGVLTAIDREGRAAVGSTQDGPILARFVAGAWRIDEAPGGGGEALGYVRGAGLELMVGTVNGSGAVWSGARTEGDG
ncbi:MAG TPA: hypothetical protein VFR14_05850 [Candidatus Limnocylindrales bacterium]|nr:hypothetical protein [Candidatus Limnocylindrales bacterium]